MITRFAHGFIAEKPTVEMVGLRSCKCEFNALWSRREKRGDAWETVWERATFVAWDDEAERVASRLDKGSRVTCTGTQETKSGNDPTGKKRYITKYRLTSWSVEPQRQQQVGEDRSMGARPPQQDRQPAGAYRQSVRPGGQRVHEHYPHRDYDRERFEDHPQSQGFDHQVGHGGKADDDFIPM